MKHSAYSKSVLLTGAAMVLSGMAATPAFAQDDRDDSGLDVIIVTAQKRAQSVQDVPIAVTALSGETLEANRITNVNDLGGLAPGVTTRVSAGGSKLVSFSMRGAVSYGVVPGSDRQVSTYLDGVYLSAPRGSIFDFPDLERIEVLRGPQGTLFGRNATAGAVSITTRDPSGEAAVKASAGISNQNGRRFQISADLPQVGPLSAYFSYVHDERDGDIRNLEAGQVWDRTSSAYAPVAKITRSPKYLGSKDADTWFAAVKFESGDFTTVYKYDRSEDNGTPDGTAVTSIIPGSALNPTGLFLQALFDNQPIPVEIVSNNKRPDAVHNGWAIPTMQKVQGHNLTSTYQISDNLSVKNVFGYRKSYIFNTSPIDGFSALPLTAEAAAVFGYPSFLVGQPFVGVAIQVSSRSESISDELQFNYDSDFLTATVGALWFKSKDWTSEELQESSVAFSIPFNGVIPNADIGLSRNRATSIAAYTQLEFHVTPDIDVVLGGRITRDKKSGDFTFGPDLDSLTTLPFIYKKTQPSYLVGVNYKPTEDILLYAKYSTAFVSGGSVAGVAFPPEKAKSWEAGVKSELFDRKLRANLALYHAKYKDFQTSQQSLGFEDYITDVTGDPNRADYMPTFIVPSGTIIAKGFEFDFSAAPAEGLTTGGSLGYSKVSYSDIFQPILDRNGGIYLPSSFRPKWTGTVWAQYDTPPLIGDSFLTFRADGIWQSRMGLAQNPTKAVYVGNEKLLSVPAYWLINGRVALRDLDLGGVSTELAAWGKNLTDEKYANFNLDLGYGTGGNFIAGRSYGVDFTVRF